MGRASIWGSLSLVLVACGGTETHGTRPGVGNDTDACATCSARDAGGGGKGHGGASGDAGVGSGGRGPVSLDGSVASPVDAGGPISGDPCNLNSGFAGDDSCILAPAPATGFQLHYGPAAYDDPQLVASYLLQPGDETDDCVFMDAPNAEKAEIAAAHLRTRPGIYLFSVDALGAGHAASTIPVGCAGGSTPLLTSIGRANEIVFSGPEGAPENQSVGLPVLAHAPLALHVHAVNTTEQAILREAWANADLADVQAVTTEAFPLMFFGGLGMNIPPAQTQVITAGGASCTNTAQEDLRILGLLSENHSSTVRAATTVVGSSGSQKVYETYDWQDPFRIRFDTVTANPAPDGVSRVSGGLSGILLVHPGDQISWECEIQNQTTHVLTFADRLYDAEMCNLRGYAVGGSPPLKCFGT